LDIILACDGASSVGQIGHEVAVKLTKENPDYEITIAKEGIKKISSLDFDEEDVKKIADKIVIGLNKDLSKLKK